MVGRGGAGTGQGRVEPSQVGVILNTWANFGQSRSVEYPRWWVSDCWVRRVWSNRFRPVANMVAHTWSQHFRAVYGVWDIVFRWVQSVQRTASRCHWLLNVTTEDRKWSSMAAIHLSVFNRCNRQSEIDAIIDKSICNILIHFRTPLLVCCSHGGIRLKLTRPTSYIQNPSSNLVCRF